MTSRSSWGSSLHTEYAQREGTDFVVFAFILTHNPGENHSDAGCVTLHDFVLLSSQQSGDTAFFDKGNSGVTVAIVGQALRVDVNLNVHAEHIALDKKRGDFKRREKRRGSPRPPKRVCPDFLCKRQCIVPRKWLTQSSTPSIS